MKRVFLLWIIINLLLFCGIGWWFFGVHIPAQRAVAEKQVLSRKYLEMKNLEHYLKSEYFRMRGDRNTRRIMLQMVQQFFDIALRARARDVWKDVEKKKQAAGQTNTDWEAVRGRVMDELDRVMERLASGMEPLGLSLQRMAYEDRDRVCAEKKITVSFIREKVEYCAVFEVCIRPQRLPEPSSAVPEIGRGMVLDLSSGTCVLSVGDSFSQQEMEVLQKNVAEIPPLDDACFRLKSSRGELIGLRKYIGFFGPARLICEVPVDVPLPPLFENHLLWIFCILFFVNGCVPAVVLLTFRVRSQSEISPDGSVNQWYPNPGVTAKPGVAPDRDVDQQRVNRELHIGEKGASATTERASSELLKNLMKKIKD